jgi:hypothetical protein
LTINKISSFKPSSLYGKSSKSAIKKYLLKMNI